MTLSKLKVDQLRAELRSRGLNPSGTKPTLLARLQAALEKSGSQASLSQEPIPSSRSIPLAPSSYGASSQPPIKKGPPVSTVENAATLQENNMLNNSYVRENAAETDSIPGAKNSGIPQRPLASNGKHPAESKTVATGHEISAEPVSNEISAGLATSIAPTNPRRAEIFAMSARRPKPVEQMTIEERMAARMARFGGTLEGRMAMRADRFGIAPTTICEQIEKETNPKSPGASEAAGTDLSADESAGLDSREQKPSTTRRRKPHRRHRNRKPNNERLAGNGTPVSDRAQETAANNHTVPIAFNGSAGRKRPGSTISRSSALREEDERRSKRSRRFA